MSPSRRGTVLILVLGLTAIMLGLVASVTARVFLSRRETASLHQSAQAFVMLKAASMVIAANGGTLASALTAGDLSPGDIPGCPIADRLGWVRIRPAAAAGSFDIVSAGGASGSGNAKNLITSGPAISNAYEVRYAYATSYDTVTRILAIAPRPVLDNASYPW